MCSHSPQARSSFVRQFGRGNHNFRPASFRIRNWHSPIKFSEGSWRIADESNMTQNRAFFQMRLAPFGTDIAPDTQCRKASSGNEIGGAWCHSKGPINWILGSEVAGADTVAALGSFRLVYRIVQQAFISSIACSSILQQTI